MNNSKSEGTFVTAAREYVGQNVAVIAARYQYRGILSKVYDDCLVIANALAVEVSGPASGERATTEDKIGGSVTIKNDAIEILYQPKWCFAPLD